MLQRINFSGVSNSPTDYGAGEGQLSVAFSLVNHKGELEAAPAIIPVFPMRENEECVFVHRTADKKYKYVLSCRVEYNHFTYRWVGEYGNEGGTIFEGIKEKLKIEALGNVLMGISEKGITYAVWANGAYTEMTTNDFRPKVQVVSRGNSVLHLNAPIDGVIYEPIEKARGAGKRSPYLLQKEDARTLWNAGVAGVRHKLDEKDDDESFYLYTLGVVALRLYDGTYFYLSDLFLIQPHRPTTRIEQKNHEIRASFHLQRAGVTVDVSKKLEGIVSGADVFLSRPLPFVEIDKPKSFIQDRQLVDTFHYPLLSSEELYKEIDTASFHHSLHIPFAKFGEEQVLKPNVLSTGEHLSLADFRRGQMGAKVAYVYNSRLHLGNVRSDMSALLYLENVIYDKYDKANVIKDYEVADDREVDRDGRVDTVYRTEQRVEISRWTEYYPALEEREEGKLETPLCPTLIVVKYRQGLEKREMVLHKNLRFPLPPLLTVPVVGAYEMTLYINSRVNGGGYFKKTFPLYNSTLGFSMFLSVYQKGDKEEVNIYPIDIYASSLSLRSGELTITHNKLTEVGGQPLFEEIDGNEYESIERGLDDIEKTWVVSSENKVRYSVVDNPFYFPQSATFTCGGGSVVALASNTTALSQGQFGQHPLYTFTTEGVWAVQLSGDGTYSSRQPIARDVIKEGASVTQTDRAIVFTSERGVMLLSGVEVNPISDVLMCGEFREEYEKAYDIWDIVGYKQNPFHLQPFDHFIETASHAYDYERQVLVLYSPIYDYCYLLSLRSKLWTMLPERIVSSPRSYPYTLFNKQGELVKLSEYKSNQSLLLSRPFKLSSPDRLKTIRSLYVRGTFREGSVSVVLYGSREMKRWRLVANSSKHYLTGISGSPYKDFRVAILADLMEGEAIHGVTIDYEDKYLDRQR